MISTITSKGQLTIPKKIRQQLKIKTGDKIEFLFDNAGHCQIHPVKSSFIELKNMVPKPKKIITLKEMQEAIEKGDNET